MKHIRQVYDFVAVPIVLAVIAIVPVVVGQWLDGWWGVLMGFIVALATALLSAWLAKKELIPIRRFLKVFTIQDDGHVSLETADGTHHEI